MALVQAQSAAGQDRCGLASRAFAAALAHRTIGDPANESLRHEGWVSHQPGLRMPSRFGAFPSRDDHVSYLDACATLLDLPIEFQTPVSRIERGQDGHWSVLAPNETIATRNVVVATGSDRVPHVPDWPGRDGFSGEFIHAGRFRHANDHVGKRVLLIGAGNSAVDIGNCLAGVNVGPVWVSVRSGATIAPQYLLGLPSQLLAASLAWLPTAWQDLTMTLASRLFLGDLSRFGWRKATKGPVTRQIEDGVTVAVDSGFVDALRTGRMRIVAEVVSFDNATVVLRDGSRLQPDAVICATGDRPGLAGLVGHLDVLDAHGRRGCRPCPFITPKRARSSLQVLAMARAMAALCP